MTPTKKSKLSLESQTYSRSKDEPEPTLNIFTTPCLCSRDWRNGSLLDIRTLFTSKQLGPGLFVTKKWRFEEIKLPPLVSLTDKSTVVNLLLPSPESIPDTKDIQYHPIYFIFTQQMEDISYRVVAKVGSVALTHIVGNIPPHLFYQSLYCPSHIHSDEVDYTKMVLRVLNAFEVAAKDRELRAYFDLLFSSVLEYSAILNNTISIDLCDLQDHFPT